MSNLIELQRNYVLSFISDIQTQHNLKFLIIDEAVDDLLSYLFLKRSELLSYVTAIEKIDSRDRKGQPSVEAIYFLKPSKFNINCMDADFSNRPPKYKAAQVRFLPGFEDHLVKFYHSKRYLTQYTSSLAEVRCAFIPRESQFFQTLGIDQPLLMYYNQNCHDLIERNIKRAVESLLNICIITGEYPVVRYSQPTSLVYETSAATILAKKLAFEFQNALDEYARNDEDFPPPSPRPRSIMIIADRSVDPFSMVLHDFTYQAMAYDAVPSVDTATDTYHYAAENELGEQEEKHGLLRELVDADWIALRHQHILDASEYLSAKINELIAKNPLLVDRTNVKSTTDMLSVVAHLKDFDEDRRRVTLHRKLIDQCLKINDERHLAELAEFEQNLAGLGLDANGERVKHLTEALLQVLMDKHANLTDKVRYIISYALYRGGIIELDLVKLLSFMGVPSGHAFFDHFLTLFRNFEYLGFKLVKSEPGNKSFKKEWFHESIVNDPNVYNTSRFVPAVGNNLSKIISNPLLLSEEAFPYVKDKPIEVISPEIAEDSAFLNSSSSLKNPRHKASWTRSTTQFRAPRQRFFYYCIGGITYSEVASAYAQGLLKNRDVFVGSDGIMTPLECMQAIEKLSEPRNHLGLKDDRPEREVVPEFLFDRASTVPAASQHVHTVSHQRANNDSSPVMPAPPPSKEKEKKRSKLAKILRSK
ncbi:LAMI_0H17480g1_1 [Lachancea mirantina]|uniref:LAMI_0H17480g1_1 n=1 Tax=Lachancea mirantina TaxID=1230905 RepID=A0A1G4KJG9_9SACH|nr:LAMI_0H17480g1_1 [Lachancea mirantina]